MSLARPIVGSTALPQQSGYSAVSWSQHVYLDLGRGWTACVAVGDDRRPGNRPGTNGTVLTQAQWQKWLSNPLHWIEQAQRQDLLKTSSTTTVCRAKLPLDDGRHIEVVCKRGHSRHLRKRLLNIFRVSRPMRTWRRAHMLLGRRIPTARPLAVVERRRFGLLLDSLIITEYLHDAVDLENLLTTQMRGVDDKGAYRIKSQVSAVLAGFLLRLQAAGLLHRDLKALNVIVQWDRQSAAGPRIFVVDLDGIKRAWSPHGRGWVRMLMRLNVSADGFRRVHLTDRVRLLKQFLAGLGAAGTWKRVWHELAALSERKREIRSRHQERAFRRYGRF